MYRYLREGLWWLALGKVFKAVLDNGICQWQQDVVGVCKDIRLFFDKNLK